MAITITHVAGQPNSSEQYQFLIDSEADIVDLPTMTQVGEICETTAAPMSTALTADGRLFVLCNDNQWHEW